MRDITQMVDRFLAWPLPESVCADPCASSPGYPGRTGTNLLNADQARQMLEHVLAVQTATQVAQPADQQSCFCPGCEALGKQIDSLKSGAIHEWQVLTEEEFIDLLPLPDGTAEKNVVRVEIAPGMFGKKYDEVTAWSLPLLLQSLPAINAALRKKNGGRA